MPLDIRRDIRLPVDQFFPSREVKSGIAIHHTVGGSALSTIEWWKRTPQIVGTAYIIERDGTVYELFDPAAWAWQFGLRWPQRQKIDFEKRFIGIEIASEGGLTEYEGELYCFDRISPRTRKRREEAFDYGRDYRGYRYFDKYEPAQIDSLVQLIDELCNRFEIARAVPENYFDYYGEKLKKFRGIIGHAMVRMDKSDPAPDEAMWQRIVTDCGVQPVVIGETGSAGNRLTREQIEQLFRENMEQINKMNVSAGSMVKGLLMELERAGRKTYLRLRDPEPDGHVVYYDLVQGDKNLVFRIARALGFMSVTENRLEVYHA